MILEVPYATSRISKCLESDVSTFFETNIKEKLFPKHPLNNLGKKFCLRFIHNGDNNDVSQKGTPLKAPT
jgi:hypothetical protein